MRKLRFINIFGFEIFRMVSYSSEPNYNIPPGSVYPLFPGATFEPYEINGKLYNAANKKQIKALHKIWEEIAKNEFRKSK